MTSVVRRALGWLGVILLAGSIGAGLLLTADRWGPPLKPAIDRLRGLLARSADHGSAAVAPAVAADPHAGHGHGDGDEQAHDHGHGAAADGPVGHIVLSEVALRQLDLKEEKLRLTEVWRTAKIPARVVELPGRCGRRVAAPVAGVVSEVRLHPNQLIRVGESVVEIRLAGEALATAQVELLAAVREHDLKRKELERITPLAAAGTVPEKNRIQLDYELKRLQSQQAEKEQTLELLGLERSQIAEMVRTGNLLREFVVKAPAPGRDEHRHRSDAEFNRTDFKPPAANDAAQPGSPLRSVAASDQPSAGTAPADPSWTVESVDVVPGQRVQIGDSLVSLAARDTLFLEGAAFERDGELLSGAFKDRRPITARFETGGASPLVREGLRILVMDNAIDPVRKTLHFHLPIANEVLHDGVGVHGETYRAWRFKPGQLATLEVPVESLGEGFILPEDGVARVGAESFVFRRNGRRLERVAVNARPLGGGRVAVAYDGAIYPGDVVAVTGAGLLDLEVRRRGGGADAAAGHGHGHDHDHGHGHDHDH